MIVTHIIAVVFLLISFSACVAMLLSELKPMVSSEYAAYLTRCAFKLMDEGTVKQDLKKELKYRSKLKIPKNQTCCGNNEALKDYSIYDLQMMLKCWRIADKRYKKYLICKNNLEKLEHKIVELSKED